MDEVGNMNGMLYFHDRDKMALTTKSKPQPQPGRHG
jgi:hypothetical protein